MTFFCRQQDHKLVRCDTDDYFPALDCNNLAQSTHRSHDQVNALFIKFPLCRFVSSIQRTHSLVFNISAYEEVNARAFEEWSYVKAKNVDQYLLLKEHHVFCMLPPPLNLLPILGEWKLYVCP
jgi:hypothetical protein